MKGGSLKGSEDRLLRKILKKLKVIECVFLVFLLSTYKCRMNSAKLDNRASSALKTGKIGSGTPNEDYRRNSKRGDPDPLDPPLDPSSRNGYADNLRDV